MMFGIMLQETETVDDKGNKVKKAEKIKTREGKSVKLQELLDEAMDRQYKIFQERQKLSDEQQAADGQDAEQQVKVQIKALPGVPAMHSRTQNMHCDFE